MNISFMAHSLKKLKTNCLTLTCLLILPMQAFAFDSGEIEVTGQGSVVITPDQFSLTLTITERGRVPSKLKALVDKKSNSVISAAKNLGIRGTNITSARVNLRIVEERPSIQVQGIELNRARQGSVFIDGQSINQQSSNVNDHKKPLFELSRQIMVGFNKIDDYDSFLEQIIKLNVSHISSLSMTVEARGEYYQQALLQAISHAKQKAQRMSKQAGRNLGEIVFIKEMSSNHYSPMYAEAMMSDTSPKVHTSQVGSQTITARVSAKFRLKD
ncbi:SIMPL domain-containing protein [Colwellia psychrerythraea]|uniref:SIMPL domain-containing protein n=1 Tax=Colwellia psychrerythraea TaxID=28229 RepID=A0A099KQQ8_COLPS|nr:SIMPL domain-containing protein [Colwellia psychrerythraea]KGJ92846.1 protein of unknown function DUF541 [Colwellia psychrerythraea]